MPASRTLLHDMRLNLCTVMPFGGGELEQIQFLLGHVSVQTPECDFGCEQRLSHAVNDNLGLERN